jgi:sulfoxide reductase heme-binding subunit YedZ
MRRLKTSGLRILIHLAALAPLALLAWDYAQGNLSADPIREITARIGNPALILLVAALAITPIHIITGIRQVRALRRTLGLYAFLYASLHLLTFVGLDYGFNFALIRADIPGKSFVFVGLSTFAILLLLAVTSTRGWQRRLGRNWQRLHRAVYLAGGLAVTHFLWAVRGDPLEPIIYAGVVTLLLIVRLPVVRKAVRQLRQRSQQPESLDG